VNKYNLYIRSGGTEAVQSERAEVSLSVHVHSEFSNQLNSCLGFTAWNCCCPKQDRLLPFEEAVVAGVPGSLTQHCLQYLLSKGAAVIPVTLNKP
jgi:hypothetical protein